MTTAATTAATIAAVSWMSRDLPRRGGLIRGPRALGATALGGGAIVLWALWPALAVGALAVPPFLLLAIASGCGFLVFAARRRLSRKPVADLFAAPFGITAVGLLGTIGSQLLGVLALRLVWPAGPVGASPWPVLSSAFGDLTGRSAGADVFLGSILAVGGVLCWIACGKARRRPPERLADAMGGLCGIAAPICLLLHLCLEPRLPLGATSLLAAAAIGLGPMSMALVLWERATRSGVAATFSAAPRRGAADR